MYSENSSKRNSGGRNAKGECKKTNAFIEHGGSFNPIFSPSQSCRGAAGGGLARGGAGPGLGPGACGTERAARRGCPGPGPARRRAEERGGGRSQLRVPIGPAFTAAPQPGEGGAAPAPTARPCQGARHPPGC